MIVVVRAEKEHKMFKEMQRLYHIGGILMEFNIEDCSDRIYHPKTKEYIREVISSFSNSNYRSAVVMLYSVTMCDLIYKLKEAAEIYQDTKAIQILMEVNARQEKNPTNSDWEAYLIDEICDSTRLLDSHEAENLRHLRKHRHLSAHPVLNQVDILFSPNPETAKAHIRNTIEGILSKGALMHGDIFGQLVEDIANEKEYLADDQTLKRYIESKYLRPMSTLVRNKVFKSLWRIVFKSEDSRCEENRNINYKVLYIMLERNYPELIEHIKDESSFFSQLSEKKHIYKKMVNLITNFPKVFEVLEEHGREKLKAKIKLDEHLIIEAFFLSMSIPEHFKFLADRYHQEEPTYYGSKYCLIKHGFDSSDIKFLRKLATQNDCLFEFYELMIDHYKHSTDFNMAGLCYDFCISPHLSKFNKENIVNLLEAVNSNRQVHDTKRRNFSSEIKIIMERADELLDSNFPYDEKFPEITFQ